MRHPITRSLALIVTVIAIACSRGEPGSIIDGKVAVTVDKARVEEKTPTLHFPAILEPSSKTSFKFSFDVKVDKVYVRLGEVAREGNPLFELNGLDLSAKTALLKGKRQEKKALFDKNQYFFDNRQRLLAEGKIDQAQFDTLEMERDKARGEFEQINAEVEAMENQVTQSIVRAPFDGIVTKINMAGGVVIPARKNLLTLVKTDPIYVAFHVSPAEAAGLTTGMTIEVKIEGFEEKPFPASVAFINPEIDPTARTVSVKASLPNPGYALRGGQQAEVRFVSQKPVRTLTIPAQAILQENEKEYVYVVREGKAWPARIYTRKNNENPDAVEIQEGLSAGDLVVTQGQEKLKAGMEVNLWR